MRQFIKYTLATLTGIAIASVIGIFVFVLFIIGVCASSEGGTTKVEDNSVLVVKLNGSIVEHYNENPVASLLGDAGVERGLDDIVNAIDAAATNDNIKGVYIEAGMMMSDVASLQEIRNALMRFKAKNPKGEKWIVSYADEYTQGAYYVCSAADKIWMNPRGILDIHGLCAETMYVKDMLEKVGVKMKVVKVGTYKSATERFTEDHMSDANREQTTRFIDGLWNIMTADISKSRKLSQESLNALVDSFPLHESAEYLIKNKLIDKTLYADEVKAEIKKMLKIDADDEIKQVSCTELASLEEANFSSSNKIAIYCCEGSIVQSAEAGVMMSDNNIVSKTMVDDLEELAKDDDVKAVVIRINSGGGDAFASEEIWHAVTALKAKKPVVVSMGGYAASGAYYLSAGASWIVAQPTTLTGSIGIFGVFPDFSNLMTNKLGLKFDNVKTNRHADFDFSQRSRPFNAEEVTMLQEYMNRNYLLFCQRVSDGRHIPLDKVKKIAEGRVWIGSDALNLKLVDQLGGIREAIAKAAALAKLKNSDYETVSYPEAPSWADNFLEAANGRGTNLDEQMRSTLGAFYEPFVTIRSLEKQNPIQARMEYFIMIH